MLVDDSPLQEDNVIYDWIAGNARIFNRVYTFTDQEVTDTVTDAYLTIKANPLTLDQNALLQIHITTAMSPQGSIVNSAPPVSATMQFNIFASQYNQLIQGQAGTSFYYDITLVTFNGFTITAETGTIFFKQGVTQADAAGTPAALPNLGIPIFRGFASGPPTTGGPYNVGDYFLTTVAAIGVPMGWVCIAAGVPGTWAPLPNIV